MQNRKIERLSYGLSWPHRKTACIRESRAGRKREGERGWLGSMDGKRGWKDRPFCQPRGAGGNIKGSGNDSWGPIMEVSRGFGLAFGSGRDASEAIYLPLPLLISCDVPRVRSTRSSFPRADTRQHFCTTSRANLFPRRSDRVETIPRIFP